MNIVMATKKERVIVMGNNRGDQSTYLHGNSRSAML